MVVDLTKIPLPSGDPNVTATVITAIWTMATVSTIFLGLRIYCRARKQIWYDDYLLITSWVFLILCASLQTAVFRLGYLVDKFTGPILGPSNLASDTAIKFSLAFSKTSFALTLLRLVHGWAKFVVITATALMDIVFVIHGVLVWRQLCEAPEPWTFQSCWPSVNGLWLNAIGSIISAISDFILALIPITIVWHLQIVRTEKIGVAIAMGLGILAGTVAIVKAIEARRVASVVGTEFSYRLETLSILIHAEANATIIAASIPVLRVLFRSLTIPYSLGSRRRKDYFKSNEHSSFHGGNPGHSVARVSATPADNESEASILGPKGQSGIKQTRQVFIEYGSQGPGSEETEDIELAYRPSARRT